MKSRGFFPNAYWYWLGVAASAGYILLFNLAYTVALTFLDCEYLNILSMPVSL